MKHLTFLIKPASSLCDMRCRYCFYDDVSDNRACKSMGIMTTETVYTLLTSTFVAVDCGDLIHILFQGGEPTLAGLDFFRTFTQHAKELCPKNVTIHYGIQTNGVSLNDEWVKFFWENNFLVGLSLDGTREFHNALRMDASGRGSWDRALHALKLLDKYKVETNLLCVVTKTMARSPQKVYQSLCKLNQHPLQFIPCLDPLEGERGSMSYSLLPQAYGKFLCGLFDCWYRDLTGGTYISIRIFDDYLRLMMRMPPSSCAASGSCGSYLVVEGDGSLYPCDFFVLDRWYLGNIHDTSVEAALSSETSKRFVQEGSQRPQSCASCPYIALCCGGCKRDWVKNDQHITNYYCESFRTFFAYALPRLQDAAKRLFG